MNGAEFGSLAIRLYPDPVLQKPCKPVTQFDSQLRELSEQMTRIMHEAKGVGLAAPQVGILARLFVFNITGEPGDDGVLINPRFESLDGVSEMEEGCLSIPNVSVTMRRAVKAVVTGMDHDGNEVTLTGEDLLARVWQHESDHLDGKLIIDRMSAADEIANRVALKQLKRDYAAARRKA